jgi:hypothetical protein
MRSNGHGKPVVALDLDGTLGDYHSNFLEFADRYFHSNCGSWFAMRNQTNPGLPLWEWMGISQRDYRDAKLAYRQGGWKRWMPAYEGAAELTQHIREAGAEVWLCTTRPYLRLDNVDPDTREWLRRNRIQYDALLFDPAHEEDGTKYDELRRQAGDRVASIVDDLPEMITASNLAFQHEEARTWLAPILREQPYNRHFNWARRANDLIQVEELVLADIGVWSGWNATA